MDTITNNLATAETLTALGFNKDAASGVSESTYWSKPGYGGQLRLSRHMGDQHGGITLLTREDYGSGIANLAAAVAMPKATRDQRRQMYTAVQSARAALAKTTQRHWMRLLAGARLGDE